MHWLASLTFATPVAVIIAIASVNQKFQPLGWLAWAANLTVRCLALVIAIFLSFAAWVAWRDDYAAVARIDWAKLALISGVTWILLTPLLLLLDLADHVKRRHKAGDET